jgi:hypothetical protein
LAQQLPDRRCPADDGAGVGLPDAFRHCRTFLGFMKP